MKKNEKTPVNNFSNAKFIIYLLYYILDNCFYV